jgi:regulator of protease activity HflC (stomatin/prohibitin superfamily)
VSKILIFLARLIGFHFVPESFKAAVVRFGMYHRTRGPGFVWVAPLVEKVENLVKVAMRLTMFTVEQVVSSDGIPFDFELTVRYMFDPDSISSRPIAAQMVRQPDHILENIVRDYADKSLRRTVAQYNAEDIYNRGPIADIEQGVIEGLKAQVRHLGLAPLAGSGVIIKEITPPEDFLETILTAKGHEIILRVLTAYQAADVDQALLAEWVRNFKDAPPGFFSSLAELLRFSGAERSDKQ